MTEYGRLGRMIRFHREMAKLSRAALTKLSGVGKTAVFDVEQGNPNVKLSTLLKIFGALNIGVTFNSPLMALFEKEQNEKS